MGNSVVVHGGSAFHVALEFSWKAQNGRQRPSWESGHVGQMSSTLPVTVPCTHIVGTQ